MEPGRPIAITQAVTGLGGVGKTYLALEYAYRYQSDYSHVLWATADSRTTLLSEFVKLAHDLDLLPAHTNDQRQALREVRQWLRTHSDWLLILDNVEDLSLVDGDNALVPPADSGTILLTTRVHVTEPIVPVEIACMSDEEGALFLLRWSNRLPLDKPVEEADPENYRLALDLSRTLGGLPLALDQAGAYIRAHCTFADYLSLYRKRRWKLLSERGGRAEKRRDHPDSVVTTFSLAFQQVQQESPAAADALRLCAMLAPDPIPEELFLVQQLSPEKPLRDTALEHIGDDPMAFHDAIAPLYRYSLVRRNLDNRTFSIHRLVQAVLRDSMTEPQRQHWEQRTAHVVADTLPPTHCEMDASFTALLPHALECARYIEKLDLTTPAAAKLLAATGARLSCARQLAEATALCEQAVQLQELLLGPEHDQLLSTRYILGLLYYEQDRYSDAARLWEQTGSPCALAAAYFRQGRYAEAVQAYQDAIRRIEEAISQETVDPDREFAVCLHLGVLEAFCSRLRRCAEGEEEYPPVRPVYDPRDGRDCVSCFVGQTTHDMGRYIDRDLGVR